MVRGALKYRNFRLYLFGQGVSLTGTWMQQVAMIWLVFRLTHSDFSVGLVGFCSQIPSFFLAPLAGVYSDRWNLHRTVIATQSLAMCQSLLLAVLVLTGTVAVWHVLALSVCLGLVMAFDIPARQSFADSVGGRPGGSDQRHRLEFVDLQRGTPGGAGDRRFPHRGRRRRDLLPVERPQLCGRAGSPAGHASVARVPNHTPQRVFRELREGLRYAFGFPPIREILLLLACYEPGVPCRSPC